MPYKTATVASGLALFDAIVADLTNGTFMGADVWVKRWEHNLFGVTAFSTTSRRKTCFFEAPGKDAEKVFVGFSIVDPAAHALSNTSLYVGSSCVDYDNGGLASGTWKGVWSSSSVSYVVGDIVTTAALSSTSGYVCVIAHTSSASPANGPTSGFGYFRALGVSTGGGIATGAMVSDGWCKSSNGLDSDLTYFLAANANRAIVTIRSGTTDRRYHTFYLGLLERFGTVDINPYPLVLTCNGNTSVYTDSLDSTFISSLVGSGVSSVSTYDFELSGYESQTEIWRYFQHQGIAYDSTVVLAPIYLVLADSLQHQQRGLLGYFDGVFAMKPLPAMQSEDTVTIGADVYRIFNNVDEGVSGVFLAIKQA